MPEEKTRRAVERDKREGKSASTQAGEFVREEIEHVREGKHGVQNTKQAIAIGLSKARRAGIDVEPGDNASPAVKKKARKDIAKGRKTATKRPAAKRSAGAKKALKATSKTTAKKAVSRTALSKQAKKAASKRTAADRSAAAKKAARTKGPAKRSAAAKKAARTRKKAS
ncbi:MULTISPECIES: DUF6496 domain-containing protein [unclassified Pseudoxanthomonas]|uniref:DUF6496 domain-containing protein n=1 Tax=unclassified Pseudoxanthomonas TaxID=2645906 RepID=UPI001611F5B1|nr:MULTISPECIES: DUF6496 domain-containing protein [unclassified Pseudoxanthomonas]MBB3275071.1 hypothetical protein [Pseudoxanthomonas sp. OG2]MBV7473837.1 DNA-binding protein [Pseudoxanthomonas sp. PXM05]